MSQQSIYQFILATRDKGGGEYVDLPDEPVHDQQSWRMMAGAFDGVFGSHGGARGGSASPDAKALESRARKALRGGGIAYRRFYDALCDSNALEIVDPLLSSLAGTPKPPMRALGLKLTTEGQARNPVKVGIAMTGIAGQEGDIDVLDVLGSHDEFTLYVAVAIRNLLKDPQEAMWNLARRVHGWGRIELVRRMSDVVTDPEIKDWLLHEGYRNDVMYEYIAQECAEVGGLLGTLQNKPVDDRTLNAATDIISSLIAGEGGPVAGMAAYGDGPDVVNEYLDEMDVRASSLEQYSCIQDIRRYVGDRSELEERRWSVEAIREVQTKADQVLNRPQWRRAVDGALNSPDTHTFDLGVRGAQRVGIDARPSIVRRLRKDPTDSFAWGKLTSGAESDAHMEEVLDLANDLLPLSTLGTGPSDDLGVALEYRDDQNLGQVIQALKRFPGRGWPIIEVGLRNRVRRNRHTSLKALAGWTEVQRVALNVDETIRQCLEVEVVEKLRDEMRALLAFELDPDVPMLRPDGP